MNPDFICFGDFRTTWSTELYAADALKAVGCRVVKVHDDGRTAGQLPWYVSRHVRDGHRTVLLFAKVTTPLRGRKVRNMTGPETATVLKHVREANPKLVVACWTFDPVRREWSVPRYEWAANVYPCCDLFLTTDAGTSSEAGLSGAKLLRQGYPGPVEARGSPRDGYKAPACHLGSAYGHRLTWLRDLSARVPGFKSFNHARGDDLFDLMASVGLVVGPAWPAFPGYWSNRLYVVTGYGGLFACSEVDGMRDEGWWPAVHYLQLSSDPADHPVQVAEYVSTLSYVSTEQVRTAGRELAVTRHTYRHRAAELVRMVNEL